MKNYSYLDMVHELLNEPEFLEFEKCYSNPIKKSLKPISHRWVNNDKDLRSILINILSKERNLSEPEFSYKWNKYNDVLFATRKGNLSPASLGSHYLHQAWLIYVQEMAASLSVQILWVKSWDKVLDMCAAPWWKTIQICDKLLDWESDKNKEWFLISNEIDSWRIKALESNLHRCWIRNTCIIQEDGINLGKTFPELFDKVLLDAPCSWEGMQYKSDKKIWAWDEKKSRKLSELQTNLLISWLNALKVGWELVYSTCTTNILENELVVSNVLSQLWDSVELLQVPLDGGANWICERRWKKILGIEDWKKVARLRPHMHNTWWFFIAKFKKVWHISDKIGYINDVIQDNQQISDEKIRNELSFWWIDKVGDLSFCKWRYTINVSTTLLINSGVINSVKRVNVWLPIFKILEDSKSNQTKLIPLVGISQIFWNHASKNFISIDDSQLKIIMSKLDLRDDRLREYEWKYVLLLWNWVGVWLVSVQKWIGKNKCF